MIVRLVLVCFIAFIGFSNSVFGSNFKLGWQKRVQSRDVVEKTFRNAQLWNLISSWDDLDKDLLWVRANHFNYTQLSKTYPLLPKEKLKIFIQLVSVEPVGRNP
jgi:hypothetical protein